MHRKPLALLAILAVGGSVSRDRLMALLWPQSDTDRARGSLKQSLHLLRLHLGSHEIVLGSTELRLNPDVIESDVQRFTRAIDAGEFERASTLYAGRFLAGVHTGAGIEFESWMQARAAELEQRHRDALEKLATKAEADGDHASAVGWWRKLQSADPTSSLAAVRLMRALDANGQRAAAIQHARVYETLMQEQWGLPPDAAVSELAARLREEPSRRPDDPERVSAHVPVTVPEATRRGAQANEPMPRRSRRTVIALSAALGIAVLAAMLWAWETTEARLARDRSSATGVPELAEKSIAVLPFADMSPAGDHEYLGDGIAEEISTRLAQIEGLRVAARTSAFQFKGTSADIRRVGAQLGVASVLEGSVRRSGDRVRITAQLIDARNGYHLWGATYEKGIGDVFAIEDTISQAIATTLRVRLTNAAAATLSGSRAEAYDHYLRGRHFLREHTAEGTRLAEAAFRKAVEIDPTLAKAYSGLADIQLNPSVAEPGPRFRRARDLADRALAMDSSLAPAHATKGWVSMWYDRDWQAAERHLRRARELDPGYTQAFNWSAAYLLATGRADESLAMMRYAYEQVPSSANAGFLAGRLLWLGRTDEALDYYRGALALDSTLFLTRWGLGRAYLELGRFDEALAEFRHPGTDAMGIYQDGHIGYTLGRAGRQAEARAVLERMDARMRRGEYVAPTDVALVHLGLGERDRALDWIERHEADRGARIFLVADPLFDPLRREPRFMRLLARLGLGAEN